MEAFKRRFNLTPLTGNAVQRRLVSGVVIMITNYDRDDAARSDGGPGRHTAAGQPFTPRTLRSR
eukprot:753548-Hanusia_phi.AAC.2